MVLTRAQQAILDREAERQRAQQRHDGGGGGSEPTRVKPELLDEEEEERGGEVKHIETAQLVHITQAAGAPEQQEEQQPRLGRGCRIARGVTTLDEQYALHALMGPAVHNQRRGNSAGRARSTSRGRNNNSNNNNNGAAGMTRTRYPEREAAKRAIDSLKETIHYMDTGQEMKEEDGEANGHNNNTNTNSGALDGEFHFRHHPEIMQVIKRHAHRSRSRRHRRASSEEDDDSSSSSSGDSSDNMSNSGGREGNRNNNDRRGDELSSVSSTRSRSGSPPARGRGGRTSGRRAASPAPRGAHHTAHHNGYGSARSASPHRAVLERHGRANNANSSSGGHHQPVVVVSSPRLYGNGTADRKRGRDSSFDSSITDDSMREESTERLARRDAYAMPSASSEDEDDVATEQDILRAARNAKESVEKNVNINYYIADAVKPEEAQKIRRRQLDRRYRHLFMAEEERKLNEETAGVGTISGSSTNNNNNNSTFPTTSSSSAPSGNGATNVSLNATLGDISPLHIDNSISFASVGGLPGHIVALREMVLLPLLYPDLLRRMQLTPPRGVLFVGPPGTGKTLLARALANEGSRCGPCRITFFMRKGADLLSKWVGESERQLNLLFEEAKRQQPSIIFFDEIDGLAPTRHTKTEQTQAALVATFLALLDGLDDRGQVVVIGATNRPDTIDPALRRPGRFDQELLFPMPDAAARRHILTILTSAALLPAHHPQRAEILDELVAHTEGCTGADLKALCTEAGLNRLRSALPQLYTSQARLRLPEAAVQDVLLRVRREDFFAAAQRLRPSLQRSVPGTALGGGGGGGLDEHLDCLFHRVRERVLECVAQRWPTAARAREKERRNCADLASAVRDLAAFPVPHVRQPLLLILQTQAPTTRTPSFASAEAQQALVLNSVALSIMKGLPTFRSLTVHLPHLRIDFAAAAGLTREEGRTGPEAFVGLEADTATSAQHIYQLVQVIQRCAPCVVYLCGAEEWLAEQGLDCAEEDTAPASRAGSDASASDGNSSNNNNNNNSSGEEEEGGEGDGVVGVVPDEAAVAQYGAEEAAVRARRMAALRYYFSLLADTEVMLLLPCARPRTWRTLLGCPTPAGPRGDHTLCTTLCDGNHGESESGEAYDSPLSGARRRSTRPPAETPLTIDLANVLQADNTPLKGRPLPFQVLRVCLASRPGERDVQRFTEHLFRTVSLALCVRAMNVSSEEDSRHALVEEAADEPPAVTAPSAAQLAAQRARDIELWRKVEYRRLQLRHVLIKWVSQYISSGRYKVLMSPDLDFDPDHPLYKEWRRHTRGSRIGLQDVLAKLENEEYVCLSQYHNDIEMLVRNVRTFFRSRASTDQRYRLKALELKETVVLSLYKINRNVIRFCEENQDVVEPRFPSDEDEPEKSDNKRARMEGGAGSGLHYARHHPAETQRKKKRYYGERRRRRPHRSTKAASNANNSNKTKSSAGRERRRSATPTRARSTSRSMSARRARTSRASSPRAAGRAGPPHRQRTAQVLRWAVSLLCGLSFRALHEVYALVMAELEKEVHRGGGALGSTGDAMSSHAAKSRSRSSRRPRSSSATARHRTALPAFSPDLSKNVVMSPTMPPCTGLSLSERNASSQQPPQPNGTRSPVPQPPLCPPRQHNVPSHLCLPHACTAAAARRSRSRSHAKVRSGARARSVHAAPSPRSRAASTRCKSAPPTLRATVQAAVQDMESCVESHVLDFFVRVVSYAVQVVAARGA